MSDLISREKAIEALERAKQNIHHNIERAIGDAVCGILDEVENGIKQLPPIQPEIVRCKDCEHGVLDDGFPHQYFCVFKGDEWNNADYFCGHAKRREVTT